MWEGEIGFVTLWTRGALDPPMVVERTRLHRRMPDFAELQGLVVESLINLDGWTQRSINSVRPDYSPLRLSPVITVIAWIVAFAIWGALLNWRNRSNRKLWTVLLLTGAVVGWFSLDAGWQISLWKRHLSTIEQYSGLDADEKRLTEVDADVFELTNRLRERLGDATARVAIFADSDFGHFRARYFLAPQPAFGRVGIRPVFVRRLRSGDALAVIDLPEAVQSESLQIPTGLNRGPRELVLSNIVGRDAHEVECRARPASVSDACAGSVLMLQQGERPWLLDSGWLSDLEAGLWRLRVQVLGRSEAGWIRLDVLDRSEENSRRWALRETYVHPGRELEIQIPFVSTRGHSIRFRLRELDRVSPIVTDVRLEPVSSRSDLVRLSLGEGAPYFIARKLVESEAGMAWELL
jgi:hypothetical protein